LKLTTNMINSIYLNSKGFAAFFLAMLFTSNLFAQIEVEPTGTLFTPENLITNVFLGDGVEVSNITFQGENTAVGYFTNGMDDVGMDRGIVMSSGLATTAATPNNGGGTTGNTSGLGTVADPDIQTLLGSNNQWDPAIYEITFVPINDTLRFKYSWASEEYPEYACSNFNDVFGFFIEGPGINGPFSNNSQNIAFIPDPSDPSGLTFTDLPVTINNVNPGVVGANGTLINCTPPNGSLAYGQYYNDNTGSTTLTYDGILDVFIAQVVVTPCEEYTIRLAVSDASDGAFDSAVFLEAKSFGTGSLEVDISTVSLDGTLAEGCEPGQLSFSLPNNVEQNLIIDYTIFGTAENGVDYEFIPDDLFIAAGDSSVTIPVIVFDDGIIEGIETIGIDIQRDPCNRDTFYFYITETQLIPPVLTEDTTICRLESIQLDGTIEITLPPPPTFNNDTDFPITIIDPNNPPPPGTPLTISEIDVFSVQPGYLQEGVIKRICINIDCGWAGDIDAYLVSPGGQFLELTTDNGAGGNDYTNACFAPTATDTIDFGSAAPSSAAPFTGDWIPEGNFADLWDGENPTNGTWQLQIKDDGNPDPAVLLDWSICFNPLYQINYSWEPSAGLSCDNCPDPIATPDTTTTYVLTATDTYGCEVYDSITITVLDVLPAPDVMCNDITPSSINFSWDVLTDADGYEVSINGGAWMLPMPGPLSHLADGFPLNTDITIVVRGTALCNGFTDTLTCTTESCTAPDLTLDNVSTLDCNGDSNGTIDVSAIGAFGPFTYMITDVDTNSTGNFTDLVAGTYSVFVADTAFCSTFITVDVTEPPAMATQEIVITNVLCNGSGEGSATFEVNGGSTPYSFNWSNGTTDSIATALLIGEYYVTITDLQGCSVIDTVGIMEPALIELTGSSISVSCNGDGDGAATITGVGGVTPYTYLWDAAAMDQATMTASGLSGGDYSVSVTDLQGCSSESIVTVIENTAVTVTLSGTAALCNTSLDGTATALASGGTGGTYTYSWDDPMLQSTSIATGLQQDTYNIIVTDSTGCTAQGTFDILAPDELVTSIINSSDANCFGAADGTISISADGGTFPYTFTWSDNATLTDSTRNDLLAGNYQLIISDGNNCSETIDFSIGEPDALATSFNNNNVNCNGNTTGTAMVIPNGGTGPFEYLWGAAANNQNTQEATGLAAGIYIVTITDANQCTFEANTEIQEPTLLELNLGQNDVLCFGNSTGDISLNVNGGTEPYVYSWLGPNGFSSAIEDIAALGAGTYIVVVTDAFGCTATISTDIMEPSTGIMPTMSPEDLICFNGSNGSATITVAGGTGPFSYVWENGSTSPTVNNLIAGTHFVTITDSGGCTSVDTAFVTQREEIMVSLSQTGPLCFDGNDGAASITEIRYNNTIANITDFTLLWSNGLSTVNTNTLVGGQTYLVTVTDGLGCSGLGSITIDNPEEIRAVIQNEDDPNCFNGNDGEATVLGIGGTAPYTYAWDNAAANQTTETAEVLSSGIYTVTISDMNDCTVSTVITIGQPDPIGIQLIEESESCDGRADGTITSIIQGGAPTYSYEWSNGETTTELASLSVGTYNLTITDANGCQNFSGAEITAPDPIVASINSLPVSCYGDEDGRIMIEATGGTPPYRYSIDGTNYSATTHYIGLDAADYTVSIIDASGCEIEEDIMVAEPLPIDFYIGEDVYAEVGPEGFPLQLESYVSDAQGYSIVTWVPPYDGIMWCNILTDNLSCNFPWVDTDNTAVFTAIAVDSMGCEAQLRVTVNVTKNRPVFVPTAFTPNNDNVNDLLLVHGKDGTIVKLFRVYDRWGSLLFQAEDFDINSPIVGWDGNFKSKAVNPGVYVWYVEVEHIDGTEEASKGNTTLIK
jgi:gliding motility-associated-like protein